MARILLAVQGEISPSLDLKRLLFAESWESAGKKMQNDEKLQLIVKSTEHTNLYWQESRPSYVESQNLKLFIWQ